MPGFHAGDMTRVGRWLTDQHTSIVAEVHATIAANNTLTALLHAALAQDAGKGKDALGSVALVDPLATWNDCAARRIYRPDR